MSYLLLIVEPTGQRATRTEVEGRAACAAMQRFGEAVAAAGQPAAFFWLPALGRDAITSHPFEAEVATTAGLSDNPLTSKLLSERT